MNLKIQSKIKTKPVSFFSNCLTPQTTSNNNYFKNQLDNDPIYFMADDVKNKLFKSYKKPVKLATKNYSCFVKLQNNKSEILNQQTEVSYNKKFLSKELTPINKKKQDFNNTLVNQRRLLSKVTIHRIRSQRQNIQSQTKRIQNSYNYLLHKMQRSKRKSLQMKQKQLKNLKIVVQSRKIKQFLQNEKQILISQDQLSKSRLRQTVLNQKANKQKSLVMFFTNRHIKAAQTREQSEKIQQIIFKTQNQQLSNKKIKYLSEKESQKKRLIKRQQTLEQRKLQAQTMFKQKWLNEFNKNTKARMIYSSKKQILGKQMQKLLQQFRNQEQNQEIKSIDSKSKIRIKSCLNTENRFHEY